ncbi:MAG: hypothetical protein F4Z31_01645 [Gemmatimonadetes bacterium]|nr:hypothetical protein [Gemmatimonadota bacterium]
MSDWLSPEQAATVLGITPHAVRERLRRDSDNLISSGLARKVDAGDDGGRSRWQISLDLLKEWFPADPGDPDADLREQLEYTQREAKVFEMEVERIRAQSEIESLQAQLAARDGEIAELKRRIEVLAGAVTALAEPAPVPAKTPASVE